MVGGHLSLVDLLGQILRGLDAQNVKKQYFCYKSNFDLLNRTKMNLLLYSQAKLFHSHCFLVKRRLANDFALVILP